MYNNFGLIFRSVKHLKLIQIFYQVFYRLKSKKKLDYYSSKTGEVSFNKLDFCLELPYQNLLSHDLTFQFLNKKMQFHQAIDWSFFGYGKLWNYNLQYFNFLNQQDISNDQKNRLLVDVTNALSHNLPLEPYPVSLRSMNMIRYYSTVTLEQRDILKEELYGQLDYLSNNLEFHLLGNHLLENGFALFMGAAAFNQEKWLNKAENILRKELGEQILGDGAHFELSPMYHQIILFRVLEAVEWYRHWPGKKIDFLNFLMKVGSKMLGWLCQISFKNGDIPHFNDSAPDVAFTTKQLLDFSSILKITPEQVALSDSGYRKFLYKYYECAVDVAPLGPTYQSGHSHADAFTFVLNVNEQPLIVDPGTSTYEIGERRNIERSTRAHNTVNIEGIDQSEVWAGFRVGQRANVNILVDNEQELAAEHDGYWSRFHIMHHRAFSFSEGQIDIVDKIGAKKGKFVLHFHPNVICTIENDNRVITDKGVMVLFSSGNPPLLSTYDFADGFNHYKKATKLEVDFSSEMKVVIKMQPS